MIRILVVPGDARPTRDEVAGADVVLKLKPASARVGLMNALGDCEVRRWPRTFADAAALSRENQRSAMRGTVVDFYDSGFALIALHDGSPRLVPVMDLRVVLPVPRRRGPGVLCMYGDVVEWDVPA